MKIVSASQDPGEYDSNGWGRPGTRSTGIPGAPLLAGAHGSPAPLPRPRRTDEELEAENVDPF